MNILLILFSQSALAFVFSTTIGQVKDHVLTSREAHLHQMFLQKEAPSLEISNSQALAVITDYALYLEAENYHLDMIPEKELSSARQILQSKIRQSETMKTLNFSDREIQKSAEVFLRAQNLMNFKMKSSATVISDAEVQNYFEQNRIKFGSASFDSFKANIRTFLIKTQVESRVREWLESLQVKYAIKNFT